MKVYSGQDPVILPFSPLLIGDKCGMYSHCCFNHALIYTNYGNKFRLALYVLIFPLTFTKNKI